MCNIFQYYILHITYYLQKITMPHTMFSFHEMESVWYSLERINIHNNTNHEIPLGTMRTYLSLSFQVDREILQITHVDKNLAPRLRIGLICYKRSLIINHYKKTSILFPFIRWGKETNTNHKKTLRGKNKLEHSFDDWIEKGRKDITEDLR